MSRPRLSAQLTASSLAQQGHFAQVDLDKNSQLPTPGSEISADGSMPLAPGNQSKGEAVLDSSDQVSDDLEEDYDDQDTESGVLVGGGTTDQEKHSRRGSIAVTLEKTDTKGRYVLRTDDTELREIIKLGIERQNGGRGASSHTGFRDLVFTRRFTTFDGRNPSTSDSPFKGFFVLFWLCMGMMLVKVAASNWRTYGSVLGRNEVMTMMFSKDVIVLGLTDGAMTLATLFGVGLQHVVLRGWLSWERSGWIIQNLWQTLYLGALVGWTLYREWPWTHTVFVVLHAMVFLMKQHSYAFYNGYLSQIHRRKKVIERKLAKLKDTPMSADRDASLPAVDSSGLRKRRQSLQDSALEGEVSNLSYEAPEIASAVQAISSGRELTSSQTAAFSQILTHELKVLSAELTGKCTVTANQYPHNLTLANWADWTCLPTLVYELEYPRQERINWAYVAEKSAATFGGIFIMMVISQAYIYPPVAETVRMKEAGMTAAERWAEFPWIVLDMLFPLLLEQLMTWYVIWECILNVLAELTRFADRGFYGDWWNSVSWDQYARDWNRPVHAFLLRHVYHSSISALRLSKGSATFVTFLLSALVHELVMWCLFKKLRGYLFAMQLMQLPLAAMSRTKMLRGRRVVGNVVFWVGLFVGPSFLTGLYLVA